MTELQPWDSWMFCGSDCRYCLSHDTRRAFREMSITFLDQQFADLDDAAVRAVRKLVSGVDDVQRVHRHDGETVVVEFFERDDDGEYTQRLTDGMVDDVQRHLHDYLSPLWRAQRKHDERYRDHKHPRKVEVRRLVAQDFKYTTESTAHYKRMAAERPDGVPVDADYWFDIERYRKQFSRFNETNLFVYQTASGTQHVIALEGIHINNTHPEEDDHIVEGFAEESVYDDVRTPCGTTSLTPQQVADGDDLVDYREFLRAHLDDRMDADAYISGRGTDDGKRRDYLQNYAVSTAPHAVLTNMCGACKRAIYEEADDGTLSEPNIRWAAVLDGGDAR